MAYVEKPPILRGSQQDQLNALRDYLFKMAGGLNDALAAASQTSEVKTLPNGAKVYVSGSAESKAISDIRKNAGELRDLILKSASDLQENITAGDESVMQYVDSKEEEYNSLYLAQSEFGTFAESIDSRISTSARGVVESYGYDSAISSLQDSIDLAQYYVTQIDGEIRRGIVLNPDTGQYELGIAISQRLQFTGECGPTDVNNPGDGFTYYYIDTGQTFGLYTSTGWQFWLNGAKVGWFDSLDNKLHVGHEIVEEALQIGSWEITAAGGFGIKYVGV